VVRSTLARSRNIAFPVPHSARQLERNSHDRLVPIQSHHSQRHELLGGTLPEVGHLDILQQFRCEANSVKPAQNAAKRSPRTPSHKRCRDSAARAYCSASSDRTSAPSRRYAQRNLDTMMPSPTRAASGVFSNLPRDAVISQRRSQAQHHWRSPTQSELAASAARGAGIVPSGVRRTAGHSG
jgi:hypothetical protein